MSLLADEPSITTSMGIVDRQRRRESAARTYARWLPIVPVRASGMNIVGADGRSYLDCLSGAGTLALGHNHPVVIEALHAVLRRGAPLHALDIAGTSKLATNITKSSALNTRSGPRIPRAARPVAIAAARRRERDTWAPAGEIGHSQPRTGTGRWRGSICALLGAPSQELDGVPCEAQAIDGR